MMCLKTKCAILSQTNKSKISSQNIFKTLCYVRFVIKELVCWQKKNDLPMFYEYSKKEILHTRSPSTSCNPNNFSYKTKKPCQKVAKSVNHSSATFNKIPSVATPWRHPLRLQHNFTVKWVMIMIESRCSDEIVWKHRCNLCENWMILWIIHQSTILVIWPHLTYGFMSELKRFWHRN